jgi:hypothetical protein
VNCGLSLSDIVPIADIFQYVNPAQLRNVYNRKQILFGTSPDTETERENACRKVLIHTNERLLR